MAAPFLAHLDVIRALKGEPKVSYPYGDVDYPVTERVQTLPRLKAAPLPFISTPEPDATRFPNNVLVEQIELQCDRTTVEVYRKYDRVPGKVLTTYTQDEETQTDVQVDTQIVVKPSAPYTQTAGSSIEYHPINGAYGRKVTSTLLAFADVSVVRNGTTTIHYPSVVTGSPTMDHFEGEDGAVIVNLQWPIVAGGSRQAASTTTFTYGASPTPVAANAYFTPELKDLVFNGLFYNVSLRGVAVNGTVTVGNFNTASDNPKWGYIGVVGPSWTGTTGASAFLSAVSGIVFSCDIAPWKYNLKRRALTTVTG
jgi:hypothetical protein